MLCHCRLMVQCGFLFFCMNIKEMTLLRFASLLYYKISKELVFLIISCYLTPTSFHTDLGLVICHIISIIIYRRDIIRSTSLYELGQIVPGLDWRSHKRLSKVHPRHNIRHCIYLNHIVIVIYMHVKYMKWGKSEVHERHIYIYYDWLIVSTYAILSNFNHNHFCLEYLE